MSAFGGLLLTNRGKTLLSKAQTGVTLQYTRIALGDGRLGTGSILELNALRNEVKSLNITNIRVLGGGRVVASAALRKEDVPTGFYFREIGLFANDPDIGEILYCYGNAGDLAEYIPSASDSDVIEKSIDIQTVVGNASNVTAVIDSSLAFATIDGAQEMVDRAEGNAKAYADETFSPKAHDHAAATSTSSGFMSNTDKSKLDGVEANANRYVHPTNHPPSIITQDANNRFVSDAEKTAWNAKETTSGAQAKVDAHNNATNVHGATSTATASRLIIRDVNGRAKVAAPAADDDIALLGTVKQLIANLVNGSPGALDTLDELAQALGDDPNFATTITNLIGTKETPAGAQAKVDAHESRKDNPHAVTKTQVGLGSVDNVQQATKAEFNSHNSDDVRHITAAERTNWNAKETPAAAQAKVDSHNNATTGIHGATPAATANRILIRDAAGRAKVAAPAADDDIALLGTVKQLIANLVNGSPGALDTLDELAQALGDDPNFATTITNLIGTKETPAGAQAKVDTHGNKKDNPHAVTKAQVGLGNVDNIQQATKAEFNTHNTDNTRHITAAERTAWNAAETNAKNASLPRAGGNITGELTVQNSPVITEVNMANFGTNKKQLIKTINFADTPTQSMTIDFGGEYSEVIITGDAITTNVNASSNVIVHLKDYPNDNDYMLVSITGYTIESNNQRRPIVQSVGNSSYVSFLDFVFKITQYDFVRLDISHATYAATTPGYYQTGTWYNKFGYPRVPALKTATGITINSSNYPLSGGTIKIWGVPK